MEMMGLDADQLRDHVVVPTLMHLSPEIPFTRNAVELLMMTAAHESDQFRFIAQIRGPACGLWQMEPATHNDIWRNWLVRMPRVRSKVMALLAPWPTQSEQLRTNLAYACGMARVMYRRCPEALPDFDNIEAMAQLAKLRWNTPAGKATVGDYVHAYKAIL